MYFTILNTNELPFVEIEYNTDVLSQ